MSVDRSVPAARLRGMAGATAAARAERRPGIAVRLGVSVVVGLVSGIFGAYCYHQVGTSPLSLNSLAHSVGLWVFLAFVVSLGLPSSAPYAPC